MGQMPFWKLTLLMFSCIYKNLEPHRLRISFANLRRTFSGRIPQGVFMKFISVSIFVFLLGCAHNSQIKSTNNQAARPLWIQQSDQIAEEFTKSLATHRPEVGSEIGYKEFDRLGLLLDINTEERDRKLFIDWIERLHVEIAKTQDFELRTDLRVLQGWLQNQVDNIDVYRKANEVEFIPAVKVVYQNLQELLNPQSPLDRKQASVDRFKVYVQGDSKHRPLLEAMAANFRTRLKEYQGKKPLLPYRGEVEQYLKDSESYLSGIEEMLKASGRSDWGDTWPTFKKQAQAYNEFVQKEVLTHSRKNPRIPKSIYAQILRRRGIESSPTQLIQTGISDYKKIYKQFQEQARLVAKKNQINKTHPAEVIQFLKSKPVTNPKDVEALYKNADQRLAKIMKENDLISIPTSPLKIRIAGDAESKAVPVPHLKPPSLVNNQGERPEFVVPSSSQGLPFDDFSSTDAAMILTAHEGRPGHDMQFSQMLDNGLSVIRSRYAVNNVNIEGWGLYAEDLVFPYLTPEEQLFALQTRLWRVARMFLDPQLQLGQIPDQRVIDVFTKELGVSNAMAGLELRRYKYDDIGQAPSYYEGYLLVKQMKEDAQRRLGANFKLKCFNDRLLSFGLLPLKISAERIKEGTLCL